MENAWIKIVALLMGLLLWFHVATEKVYKYRLSLPITDITLGEKLTLAKAPPDSFTVVVSASGKQLLRRQWRQRGIRIMAAQLGPGRHTLSLTTANTFLSNPGGFVRLEEIVSPTSMLLSVDYIAERKVAVRSGIAAVPDEGFAVLSISPPQPAEVTLRGARSLVREVSDVTTEPRVLANLRDNLTITLPLAEPEGYQVVLQPDSVTLAITIVAVKTRVIDAIPVMVINAPTDRHLIVFPPQLEIELTGPPDDIDTLSGNSINATVDYSELDSRGRGPVTVICPTPFKVKKISVDTVTVFGE